MTDERIKKSVDSIEPNMGASRRMYDGILDKAAAKRKNATALRTARRLVSAAACICLVTTAAVLFTFGSADKNGSMSAGGANIDLSDDEIIYKSTYFSEGNSFSEDIADMETVSPGADLVGAAEQKSEKSYDGSEFNASVYSEDEDGTETETLEATIAESEYADGIASSETFSLVLPDGALCFSDYPAGGNNGGTVPLEQTEETAEISRTDFAYNEHLYTLSAYPNYSEMLPDKDSIIESEEIDPETHAVIYLIDTDGAASLQTVWTCGEYNYVLINRDGEEKDMFIDVSYEIIENNKHY